MATHAGMARFTCHDPNNVWDLVPCDTVASCILLTAAAVTSKVCSIYCNPRRLPDVLRCLGRLCPVTSHVMSTLSSSDKRLPIMCHVMSTL